jgi:hypothetical protein
MPIVYFPTDELEAIGAVLMSAEKIDWDAYERAKSRLIFASLSSTETEREEYVELQRIVIEA